MNETVLKEMARLAQIDAKSRIDNAYKHLLDLSVPRDDAFDLSTLMEKMFELFHCNDTTFYSLFHRVLHGGTDLNTIDGLEALASFLGNFIDDAYFKIVKETNEYGSTNPILTWHIVYANDDDTSIGIEDLEGIINDVMTASQEWAKQCEKVFGPE